MLLWFLFILAVEIWQSNYVKAATIVLFTQVYIPLEPYNYLRNNKEAHFKIHPNSVL